MICECVKDWSGAEGKQEATEKVPITAFLSIFSVTLFKNYRKRTLKILRSEVFQWPRQTDDAERQLVEGGSRSRGKPDGNLLPARPVIQKVF